jgi:tRNA dimethylallyltransferase
MRFPTLLFWVHADTDALKGRLDRRVDKMLEQGLIGEVETLNTSAQIQSEAGHPVDETRGIWVSIGYKEFKAYAYGLKSRNMDDNTLEKLKAEALEKTKAATRQYAKRQVRWIRIKLVNALARANVGSNLYVFDGSDVSKFEANVVNPALTLAGDFLSASSPMPEPASLSSVAAELLKPKRDYDLAATPEKWTRQICEPCGVTCVNEDQWSKHINSKAHKRLLSKRRKVDAAVRERSNGNFENALAVSEKNLPS